MLEKAQLKPVMGLSHAYVTLNKKPQARSLEGALPPAKTACMWSCMGAGASRYSWDSISASTGLVSLGYPSSVLF